MNEIIRLLDRWCPGLNDELQGFADASSIPVSKVAYYAGTHLRPSCSQIAISAQKSANGHPILARSYEYHHDLEEFTLARTCADGKNVHIGTCVMMFGREEGINDKGLAVAMSMNTGRQIKTRGMMYRRHPGKLLLQTLHRLLSRKLALKQIKLIIIVVRG